MALITVNRGGTDIPPGVYQVILTGIEGPKTIVPQSGPNAGQDVDIFEWNFAIDDGDLDGTEVSATTSTNSGPRSKMYAFLTALLDGKPPQPGQTFEASDLVGRIALATISQTESGWPRIENLGAMPASMKAATAKPSAPAKRVVAPTTGAGSGDDLPF